MICGNTDRYTIPGVKGWWRRWCWEPAGHKGSCFRPPEIPKTFGELVAEWAAEKAEAKRLAELPQEPEVVIVQPQREVEGKEMPSGPKKVMAWLAQNPAWTVRAGHTRTSHRAELYAADSKSSGAKKGDVKKAAYEQDNWFIHGALRVEHGDRVLRAYFRASWAQVKGCTFDSALVRDNLEEFMGVPETGSTEYVVSQTGEFDDWLRALAPTGAPVKRDKKVKQAEATAEDLLLKGEWNG